MIDSPKQYLTIKEVAERLCLCYESIRRIVANGRLHAYSPTAGKILISPTELDNYMHASANSRGKRKARPTTESLAR